MLVKRLTKRQAFRDCILTHSVRMTLQEFLVVFVTEVGKIVHCQDLALELIGRWELFEIGSSLGRNITIRVFIVAFIHLLLLLLKHLSTHSRVFSLLKQKDSLSSLEI
jgi:hypothetical protein